MINQDYFLGLTGFPLEHSLSPLLHQAALNSCGLSGNYSLFPIEPGANTESRLRALCEKVRDGSLSGFNVTIPYKQAILSCVDEVNREAGVIGAVNTVYRRDGRAIGDNTDAGGFLKDLANLIDPATAKSALVLGAGGAARAVVFALVNSGWKVYLAARRIDQAEELAASFAEVTKNDQILPLSLTGEALSQIADQPSLIVNATPVGMSPKTEQSPWPTGLALPDNAVLYDLIYNPYETYLMKRAAAQKILCRNGLGMLIEQAALTFEKWTGQIVDRQVLWNSVRPFIEKASGRKP
jgi:shikimate dehydrogenase